MTRLNPGARLNTMPPADQLTPTEARVWAMKQAGKTNHEIADELGMKVVSVRRRLVAIREKVACHEA